MKVGHRSSGVVRAHRVAAWLLGAFIASAAASCADDAGTAPPESVSPDTAGVPAVATVGALKQTAVGYHDQWRTLWEDHITWTRMVIIGILDDLPGTDAYVGRLLQNYEDMESALVPYYGEESAEAFGDLIKDHLTIAADILVNAKAGDEKQVTLLVETWRANARALAKAMNELNPRAWPLRETDMMWQQHLNVTLAEATAHLSGDFAGELAAWERVHGGGLQMADFISGGVMHQFRGSFAAAGCIR
jgi:hypothetical protein